MLQRDPADVDAFLGGIVDDSLSSALELRTQHEDPDPINLMRTAFPWPWADYQLDLLDKLLSRDYSRLVIMAPPRHRKTTVIAGFMAIAVGEDPATRIMIASHTRDYSSLLMNQAEAIMRMPIYQRYYGDLLPKGKESRWSTHERHLPNRPVAIKDPTFLALSPDSGTPGFGADIIVADDVVSQANSSSATKRRHLEHWINASLLKRLEPDGKVIVIGARFYKEDYYGTLVDNPQVWESIILKASPEKPLWPWRWPSEALEQKQLEDPVFYPAQYLQDPLDIGSGVLDPSWFNFYLELPPRSGMAIFAGVDPVIKTRGSKFSYAIVGRDQQGKVYLLDHYSARHSDIEQAGLIDRMWEQWRPVLVAFESNGPQESVMHFVQKDLKHPVNIIGVPSLTSKFLRLSSIAGHTRTGRVLLEGKWNDRGDELQPTPLSKPITKAWGKFPGGDTDLLDAFEKAVNIALQGPPPAFGSSSDAEHARKREENIKEAREAQRPGQRRCHPFTEPPQYGRVFRQSGRFALGPND